MTGSHYKTGVAANGLLTHPPNKKTQHFQAMYPRLNQKFPAANSTRKSTAYYTIESARGAGAHYFLVQLIGTAAHSVQDLTTLRHNRNNTRIRPVTAWCGTNEQGINLSLSRLIWKERNCYWYWKHIAHTIPRRLSNRHAYFYALCSTSPVFRHAFVKEFKND